MKLETAIYLLHYLVSVVDIHGKHHTRLSLLLSVPYYCDLGLFSVNSV